MTSLALGMKNQIRPCHTRRVLGLMVVFVLGFVVLALRLVELQVLHHDKYRSLALKNTQRIFLVDPKRGDILDAQGNPLATSVPVKKICADPYFVGPFAMELARKIGPLLGWNAAELATELRPRGVTNASGKVLPLRYVDLHRKFTIDEWETIEQTLAQFKPHPNEQRLPKAQKKFYESLRTKSLYAVDDQLRYYPNDSLAAHVIGYAQVREEDFNSTSVSEIFGINGVERWFNEQMAGARGWRITEVDRRRRELIAYREQNVEPRPGLHTVLTIDMVVQGMVEAELANAMREFSPISASAVVVRPRTGEILAMATLPSFNPNHPGQAPMECLKNRIISDRMEPGSTFKIITVASALNEGAVTLNDQVFCENGYWLYAGKPLRDAGTHHYGLLSVQEVLAKSSNIGVAKIALKLGDKRLYDYALSFGFGAKTGITLTGEDAGKVPDINNRKEWNGLTVTRLPMGQSVAVTHLQMVMAVCAIANDGWLMRPMLVKRLVNDEGEVFVEYPPQRVRQVVSEQAATLTTQALKTVVAEGGTGIKATLDHYTVAGKTGTAEKPDLVHGGYMDKESIHSFIGYFPADAPEICISVVLDGPGKARFASGTAVPTFQHIASQVALHLKIQPDRDVTRDHEGTGLEAKESRRLASVPATHP